MIPHLDRDTGARLEVVASRTPLEGLRILIVDDDEAALEALRVVLQAEGAEVVSATSGAAALNLIDEAPLDAMVTDLSMPVVDGFTLVEQLRHRPASKGGTLPVAALTGYLSSEDRARALLAGCDAYLVKPVDPAELIDTVKTLARRKPLIRL